MGEIVNGGKLDEIYKMAQEGKKILNTIDESLRILLTKHMIDEYEALVDNLKPHIRVHIFFNCDEQKSPQSMNIFYNHCAYSDLQEGRTQLMDKIVAENNAGKIIINEEEMKNVKNAVLKGDPAEASQYMKYGYIITLHVL